MKAVKPVLILINKDFFKKLYHMYRLSYFDTTNLPYKFTIYELHCICGIAIVTVSFVSCFG